VGAGLDTGWNINQFGPNRVYRATVPVENIVAGDATYAVSGVGNRINGADGQGASLVVIYSRAGTGQTGKIFLRHGGLTVRAGQKMSHSFAGLTVPTTPSQVSLHVGMGDGTTTAGGEDPMRFQGTPITEANFFFGEDGPMWDAVRIPISTTLLPAGTTSRTNSIQTVDDSLAWGYAILAYQHP
jgi:hypothetical protein